MAINLDNEYNNLEDADNAAELLGTVTDAVNSLLNPDNDDENPLTDAIIDVLSALRTVNVLEYGDDYFEDAEKVRHDLTEEITKTVRNYLLSFGGNKL